MLVPSACDLADRVFEQAQHHDNADIAHRPLEALLCGGHDSATGSLSWSSASSVLPPGLDSRHFALDCRRLLRYFFDTGAAPFVACGLVTYQGYPKPLLMSTSTVVGTTPSLAREPNSRVAGRRVVGSRLLLEGLREGEG